MGSKGTSSVKDIHKSLPRHSRCGEEKTEDSGKFSPPGVGSIKSLRACLSEREEKQREITCLDSVGDNAHPEHILECLK